MAPKLKYVYCHQVGSGDCYKIGHTKNPPEQRKRGLQTGSREPYTRYKEIETEYPLSLEKRIHKLLDHCRAATGEFFYVTKEELDAVIEKAIVFVSESEPLLREAKKLRREKPTSTVVEASPEMLDHCRELRELDTQSYLIEKRIEFLQSRIQVAIGHGCGMRGVATWRWKECPTMDVARFKREHKALYEQYKRDSSHREFHLERVDLTRTATLVE
jgi:T5orf172 domain